MKVPVAARAAQGPGAAPAPPSAVAGRLLVVGCARAGTTLLQSLLAAYPAVRSFPETAVFGRLLGKTPLPGETRPDTVHRRTQVGYRHVVALLDSLGRRDLECILPMRSRSIGQFVDGFIAVLDRLTLDHDRSWWVEKTPENLAFVPQLLELVPGAKVINVLRDGRQNVASLYDMACRFPDRWWVRFRDLDRAIAQWNNCARRTRSLLARPDVLLVRHERLRSDTEAVLQQACAFVGLPFTRDMLERRADAARHLVTVREPWKADVLAPLRPAIEDKFSRLFDAEQRAYIEARLEPIDF